MAREHSTDLVEKSQKGNQQAFGKLMGLWYQRIYNLAFKYFNDHDLAMEITQQTFITVHQKIDRLKNPEAFKCWLYKLALNHCRQEDRRQKRFTWISIFNMQQNSDEVEAFRIEENQGDQQETTQLLQLLIQKLPEEQRCVLLLKEYEGLKFREIAEALGISENTAKSRLYYALNHLKKGMEKYKYGIR
ncbi:MAG: RNA polymerase sigma factor [Cyclobacteriaceae bacterium]|nr:RNA polymerase sigma factor [Cyclobacteriaceae bacterium]